MASTAPFSPRGNSYALSVTNVSGSLSTSESNNLSGQQYLLTNLGVNALFFAYGPPGSQPVAVIPTAGSPANGVCLPAGVSAVFTLPSGAVIAAITASSTTTLYISVGEGI